MPKALVPDIRTVAEKRRDTLANKKFQEQVQLRQVEASGKVPRAAMAAALKNAGWRGAVPTGSQKRALSPVQESGAKKAKVIAGVRQPPVKVKLKVAPAASGSKVTKSKRRRPAVIRSDDEQVLSEVSAGSVLPVLAVTGHYGHQGQANLDDNGSQAEDDTADERYDDEAEELPNDSLQDLGAKELISTLQNERAQWNATKDQFEEVEPQLELTTTSETDFFVNNDEEEVGEDEGNCTRPLRKISSKRASDRLAEAPMWQEEGAVEIDLSDCDEGSDGDIKVNRHDVNHGWSPEAHYIPAKPGARLICIKSQPDNLQDIIKAAIRLTSGDAIADNAYPPADKILAYYRKALIKCATKLDLPKYAKRFKIDSDFGNTIGHVLNGRLSIYRGTVKKVATSKVEGFYTLIQGPECKTKIESLLHNTSYIYPRRSETLVVRTKPFQHPAIISILREVYFVGARGSLADKHKNRFISIIKEGPAASEREIPAAMLALVATCIHSALEDYTTTSIGVRQKGDFNADLYEDVYKGHVKFLDDIREASNGKYHRLMADIFNEVCLVMSQRTATVSNNAKHLLDIDGMPDN